MAKKVFIIAYYFPPCAASGTFRTLGFVRHLVNMGWRISVLKARTVAGENDDPALLEKIPAGVRVIEAPVIDVFRGWDWVKSILAKIRGCRDSSAGTTGGMVQVVTCGPMSIKDQITSFFKLPDNSIGWFFPAIFIALLRQERPNIIYSSAPPFSGHLIGVILKKIWRVPLVCDFRDPWFGNPFRREYKGWLGRWDRALEKLVFKNSDSIIANTNKMKVLFVTRYPDHAGKIQIITNGFDPGDFGNIEPERTVSKEKLLLVHPGSLYGQRNPVVFLRGLSKAIYESDCKELAVQFIGPCGVFEGKSIDEHLADLKLENYVELVPSVSHAKALSLMKGADVLLLFSQGTQIQVPAKLYEYMALEKPIIGVCEKGSACWDLLQGCDESVRVIENCKEKISEQLKLINHGINKGQNSDDQTGQKKYVKEFDREILALKLSVVFEKLQQFDLQGRP